MLSSDLQLWQRRQAQNLDLAEQVWHAVSEWLDRADRGLSEVENQNGMLGSAIVRGCQELADAVGHVAEHLLDEQQQQQQLCGTTTTNLEEHQRRALAEAYWMDYNQGLRLLEEEQHEPHQPQPLLLCRPSEKMVNTTPQVDSSAVSPAPSSSVDMATTALVVSPPKNELGAALGATAELLRDVEVALRAVEQDEADDLADAAIGVAHLFLLSCRQLLHSQFTPQKLVACMEEQQYCSDHVRESPQIELLHDDDDNEDHRAAPSSGNPRSSRGYKYHSKQPERLRCLWPPLGPAVERALHWTKQELEHQHWLLCVALGVTLWPVAVATACVGAPALLADHGLQTVYQHFQTAPLLTAAEVAAAQVYQTSRLAWLTGRAVARPTLRVAQRQCQRHGPAVQEWAVRKWTHPVDTVQEMVGGLLWCTGQLVGMVRQHVVPKFGDEHRDEDSDDEVVVKFENQCTSLEEILSL